MMNPQTRNPAGGRGFGERKRIGGCVDYAALTASRPPNSSAVVDDVPSLARIPELLRHHANYVEVILGAVCAGRAISTAGRQALMYTADRLRQCAKVLE